MQNPKIHLRPIKCESSQDPSMAHVRANTGEAGALMKRELKGGAPFYSWDCDSSSLRLCPLWTQWKNP